MMHGTFWVVWFVASAGAAKLLAMAENSIHGLGWKRPFLQRVRAVHNVLLLSYPPTILWTLGLSGPRLVWTEDWSRIPVAGWLALGAGCVGFGYLIASTVRHWTYRPPACETAVRSRIVDIAAQTTEALVGAVRGSRIARLPFNEQFTLEVHEKTYVLPRLPQAWDGLSIVHFSDCHFRGFVTEAYFQHVMDEVQRLQGDIVAFTGDLLDRKECVRWIPGTLGRVSAPLGCYFVLGNHDWYVEIEDLIRQSLTDAGWIDISGRVIDLEREGARVAICGSERPWLGTDPDLSAVDDAAFRLLLSHSPDQIVWARRNQVDLMLAGHTHGGQIRLPILGPVYSPSVYGCRYASGVFWEPPTLMSVTRGVSGREPIRYNCRPEVTKLILRSGDRKAAS